jgi:hypothetical protein
MTLFRWSSALSILAAVVACRNDVQPEQLRIPANYTLESVDGRGPTEGSLSFLATGQVIRRVRYTQPDGALSAEYVAVGTFIGSGTNGIQFNLRENGGASSYVWTVYGSTEGTLMVLRYPDPADGWITERYRQD